MLPTVGQRAMTGLFVQTDKKAKSNCVAGFSRFHDSYTYKLRSLYISPSLPLSLQLSREREREGEGWRDIERS